MIKLSNTSRIILGIASLSLAATYFLPIWRIDLFAPQYPEGLLMNIWLDNLSGQIDIINGLNHYIGMRHISVEMFPEFSFLKYIVAFYILLGLAVALIGKRQILFWYIIFTLFGATFALYDYYRWGFEYGHNLDPLAPIKMPGLSFQPPLIGHKRLLNFDAYSSPDSGGWIIIVVAAIFFGVWFFEKYKAHKKKPVMKTMAMTVILLFTLSSCKTQPEPIKFGTDACHLCKMIIVDEKFGAELVTPKGKVYKFDDIGCLIRMIQEQKMEQEKLAYRLVTSFEKKNEWLDVSKAIFVVSDAIRSPMNYQTAAFPTRQSAESFLEGKPGMILSWEEIYKRFTR